MSLRRKICVRPSSAENTPAENSPPENKDGVATHEPEPDRPTRVGDVSCHSTRPPAIGGLASQGIPQMLDGRQTLTILAWTLGSVVLGVFALSAIALA
jgi:hypothetical protein